MTAKQSEQPEADIVHFVVFV